jgi:hypothetical protein
MGQVGFEASKIAELQNLGWEVVSQIQGAMRTELAFRIRARPSSIV